MKITIPGADLREIREREEERKRRSKVDVTKKKKKETNTRIEQLLPFLSFIFAFSFKEGKVTCLKSVFGDSGRSLACLTVEILILK